MSGEYAKALGGKLRTVRNQRGLSLQGVEATSQGRWKAVVIGSYERGDRAVTVQRLSELAEFYGVPLTELLPDEAPAAEATPPARLDLDLNGLAQAPADLVGPLVRFVAAIQSMRAGPGANSSVLSVRSEDLRTLALVYDLTPGRMAEVLADWGVLRVEGSSLGS